jgi:hypothetical protein
MRETDMPAPTQAEIEKTIRDAERRGRESAKPAQPEQPPRDETVPLPFKTTDETPTAAKR